MALTPQGMSVFRFYVRWIDMPISRLTGGRFIPSANGNIMPIYYLTSIGARSGLPRSIPVLCIPDGAGFILVGSNWGKSKNPGWVYNLRSHPKALLHRGRMKKYFIARELHGNERDAYWQKAVAFYPPYVSYERHASRLLPVFLLES
jgi:deazaflavin-dependent oxidoreductase (nitroreductase family)